MGVKIVNDESDMNDLVFDAEVDNKDFDIQNIDLDAIDISEDDGRKYPSFDNDDGDVDNAISMENFQAELEDAIDEKESEELSEKGVDDEMASDEYSYVESSESDDFSWSQEDKNSGYEENLTEEAEVFEDEVIENTVSDEYIIEDGETEEVLKEQNEEAEMIGEPEEFGEEEAEDMQFDESELEDIESEFAIDDEAKDNIEDEARWSDDDMFVEQNSVEDAFDNGAEVSGDFVQSSYPLDEVKGESALGIVESGNVGFLKWYSGSSGDAVYEFGKNSPSGSFEGDENCNVLHVNVGYDTYGWEVQFPDGVIMNLRDVREYQIRNGRLPSTEGRIIYGQKTLMFSGVERIVVYESVKYFSYGI